MGMRIGVLSDPGRCIRTGVLRCYLGIVSSKVLFRYC